jgi:drug/metabolite transporter (DMT)-like permease
MSTAKSMHAESPRRVRVGPGEVWALASAVGYAFTSIFSRIAAVAVSNPIFATIFRALPTLTIGWTRFIRYRAGWGRLKPSAQAFVGWRTIAVMLFGGTMNVIGTVAFFKALEVGGVVLTAPVQATNVLWSAVLAALLLKEPLTPRMSAGIFVAMMGVGFLGYGRSASSDVSPEALWAIPLTLLTTFAWALSGICTRYALTHGADKYMSVALAQSTGTLVLFLIVVLSGQSQQMFSTSWETLGTLLLAGVLSALALYAGAQAYVHTTVASVATISSTNPVIATLLAVILLNENLNALMAVGMLLTVVGVTYVQLTKETPEAIAEPELIESLSKPDSRHTA